MFPISHSYILKVRLRSKIFRSMLSCNCLIRNFPIDHHRWKLLLDNEHCILKTSVMILPSFTTLSSLHFMRNESVKKKKKEVQNMRRKKRKLKEKGMLEPNFLYYLGLVSSNSISPTFTQSIKPSFSLTNPVASYLFGCTVPLIHVSVFPFIKLKHRTLCSQAYQYLSVLCYVCLVNIV